MLWGGRKKQNMKLKRSIISKTDGEQMLMWQRGKPHVNLVNKIKQKGLGCYLLLFSKNRI